MAALDREGVASPIPMGRPSQNLGNPLNSQFNHFSLLPQSVFATLDDFTIHPRPAKRMLRVFRQDIGKPLSTPTRSLFGIRWGG